MSKNYDALGAVLLLLIISGVYDWEQKNRGGDDFAYSQGKAGSPHGVKPHQSRTPGLLSALSKPPQGILNDFHRMTDAMGRFDALGRMISRPEALKPALKKSLDEMTAKNSSLSLPDLSSLAGAIGPLLSSLSGGN